MKKQKVTLMSQGCRLNHAETASMLHEFSNKGYAEVGLDDAPDVVVINTCTVTENGDKDTLKLVKKINQKAQGAKIALIGCQAQIQKSALMELENVSWVIGNEDKQHSVSLITGANKGVHVSPFKQDTFFQEFSSFDPRHTRVNLKIQDGCNFYCAFCIIPFARGPARSRDFQNILSDANALVQLGVKELVLTGINLGTYENNNQGFYDVLESLLKLNPDTHIRISSIEPTTIDDRLIQLWHSYPNFCPYLHLPIQSGSDAVLKLMRRKYTLKEYHEYLESVVEQVPDICIGTDVIVGFPGESEPLFLETLNYLKSAPIHYFHVFSYSERTMAHARKFDHKVAAADIKSRSAQLRALSEEKWRRYRQDYMKQPREVLFEQQKSGAWVGSTQHFVKVKLETNYQDLKLKNQRHPVKLMRVEGNYMIGALQ